MALLAATRARIGSASPPLSSSQAERPYTELPTQRPPPSSPAERPYTELPAQRAASKVTHNNGAGLASLTDIGIEPIPNYCLQTRQEIIHAVRRLGLDEFPKEGWRGRLVFQKELGDDAGHETQLCWCICILYENNIEHRIDTFSKIVNSGALKGFDLKVVMSFRDELEQMIRVANQERYTAQIQLLRVRERKFVNKLGLEGYESPIIGESLL